ncbi:hypothetical protein WJX72_008107 [[Myrmecia] bisecta]|uniref:glycerophosphodiester phosphodiesterase n=1 Tax=[Myrmecia] bisecta TaxID=41462 RepID=A0AAW1QRL9_9CHLO
MKRSSSQAGTGTGCEGVDKRPRTAARRQPAWCHPDPAQHKQPCPVNRPCINYAADRIRSHSEASCSSGTLDLAPGAVAGRAAAVAAGAAAAATQQHKQQPATSDSGSNRVVEGDVADTGTQARPRPSCHGHCARTAALERQLEEQRCMLETLHSKNVLLSVMNSNLMPVGAICQSMHSFVATPAGQTWLLSMSEEGPPIQDCEPIVISHRAGGNEAPENTLAALRNAEKSGSRVMQMDILQTSDGVPVIFHDTNMKRATGVDVDIKTLTASQLPKYKEVLEPLITLGAEPLHTPGFGDAGCQIPTLQQLLEEAAPETYFILEFWEEDEALIRKSVELIQAAGRQDRVILGNPFSGVTWQMCRAALPEAPIIMNLNHSYKLYAFYMLGLLRFWTPPAPHAVLNIPLLTGWEAGFKQPSQTGWKTRISGQAFMALVRLWKWLFPRPGLFKWLQAHGIPVVVFIHNRPEDWDYDLGLDGITAIQTDNPAKLAAYLDAHDPERRVVHAAAAAGVKNAN